MKKIMNISKVMFLLGILIMVAVSCNKNEDLLTEDAQTGGLLVPTSSFFYVLGVTTVADIVVVVPAGPQINEIYVYNKYIANDTTESNEVLMQTLTGFGNQTTMSLTYAQLKEGLIVNGEPMPASDTSLPIGSSFVLRYEVKLADGRHVVNVATSTIGISNFFAGKYQDVGTFIHPVNGPRAINEEKDLVALNAFECRTTVGDLKSYGYTMRVNIDPSTNVAKVIADSDSGSPELFMSTDKQSKYDPVTKVITLNYYYVGATGNRVIEEVYTPK